MKLTLINRKNETSDCISFFFQPEQEFSWQAGQFLRYQIADENADERGVRRYFTISAAPFEKNVRITTRINKERSSSFKKDLASLKLNDTIEAEGPMGSFTMADLNQHYIFIAGGIGITPFRSIIVQLAHDQKPINITLLYANRNNEIVFKDELDQIAQKNPSFQIHYIIDPQKIDLQALTPYSNSPYSPTFYLSGPEPMVQGIEKLLSEQLQVPTERIKTDYFPGYSGI